MQQHPNFPAAREFSDFPGRRGRAWEREPSPAFAVTAGGAGPARTACGFTEPDPWARTGRVPALPNSSLVTTVQRRAAGRQVTGPHLYDLGRARPGSAGFFERNVRAQGDAPSSTSTKLDPACNAYAPRPAAVPGDPLLSLPQRARSSAVPGGRAPCLRLLVVHHNRRRPRYCRATALDGRRGGPPVNPETRHVREIQRRGLPGLGRERPRCTRRGRIRARYASEHRLHVGGRLKSTSSTRFTYPCLGAKQARLTGSTCTGTTTHRRRGNAR